MTPNEPVQYFVYTHRGLQYALPVMNIHEIVQVSEWLPFHGDVRGCLGNIVHRDTLLPVFDPTVLGTNLPEDPTQPETVIVVKHRDTTFGLAIDRHLAVIPLDTDTEAGPSAHPTTGNAAAGSHRKPFVETVRVYRNNTLITFSVAAISDVVQHLFGDQRNIAANRENEPGRLAAAVEMAQQTFTCARIESISFGIPVEKVIEVIEDYDVTPLYKVTPGLRGVINLRGQVLACLDVSQDLGFPPRKLGEHNQYIVLQGDGTELALCVDKVLGIRLLPHNRIQKAEAVLSGEITRYVHGILETEHGTIMILSVPDIFASPHLQPYQGREA